MGLSHLLLPIALLGAGRVALAQVVSTGQPSGTDAATTRASAVYDGRARKTTVAIPRFDTTVVIDGQLDEAVWRDAPLLTGFSQYRPVDGRPADDSTQVLVWYGPDAIYFGVRAYEAHGPVVRATLADRDNIDSDDRIQILLDTYDDHRRALLFAVNPLGVQEDGVWSDGFSAAAGGASTGGRLDATIDLNPDYVYQSRGRVTDWGYEIEVRIPFKSLRYQSGARQDWGLQVLRTVQHTGHEDTWAPAFRANASFLIQSGTLAGLTDMHRGLVMDVTPELTSKLDGAPRATGYGYRGATDLGGTLRWGVTPNLSAVATAHPDFSQVEADVGQVTANQRFALFFPEKRPFFLEGLEQYDTPNRLIYTRRVVQPDAGAKLTGKIGSTSIAYLGAVDARDEVTGQLPVYNMLRLRRDVGPSSTAGLVYTDRVEGNAYNRVFGGDTHLVWNKVWFTQVQVVGAWTSDERGSRTGALWDVVLADRTGRRYGNHYEINAISPDFETQSGFVNRTGIVTGTAFNRWSWYGAPGALVEQVTTFQRLQGVWRYGDFGRLRGAIEGGYDGSWQANLRGGWQLSADVTNSIQRFDSSAYVGYGVDVGADTVPFVMPHGLYNLWGGSVGVTTPNRVVTATATLGYSAAPIFAEAAEGRQLSLNAEVLWRPTQSLRIDALWTHQTIDRARDGSRFATADIPRLKVEYQLTRAIFFRYVGQYFAQDQSALRDPRTGAPIVLDSAAAAAAGNPVMHELRSDVLFSYRPTPGTVFLLGYGATLSEPEAFRFRDMSRESDGFFLKMSYLFRM
ncbi:MAG: carbohydrate binding family 9 domain-containing protein [Gemmatimonadaceae bacterium]|nr:carbohydrate binding family 9 domain-containing protein [Gemmatimonadaceae bacterium]